MGKEFREENHMGRRFWLVTGLGGCPRCMRCSFVAACACWLGWLASFWLDLTPVRLILLPISLGATMWWLAHWGAYVGKCCLVASYSDARLEGNRPSDGYPPEFTENRRIWLGTVLRYATVGTVATLLGMHKVFGEGPVPCGLPSVLFVASPTEECAHDLADAFRGAVIGLQVHGSTFADFICAQRSATCGRRRCRRFGARNPEDIRPDIRLVLDKQGRRLWCVRCFGKVRIICGCV